MIRLNAGNAHLTWHMSLCNIIRTLPWRGLFAKVIRGALLASLLLLIIVPRAAADLPSAGLDRGFLRLYDLDFNGAQKEFESWEKDSPTNPMALQRDFPDNTLFDRELTRLDKNASR